MMKSLKRENKKRFANAMLPQTTMCLRHRHQQQGTHKNKKQHGLSTLSDAAIRSGALKHNIVHDEKIENKKVKKDPPATKPTRDTEKRHSTSQTFVAATQSGALKAQYPNRKNARHENRNANGMHFRMTPH